MNGILVYQQIRGLIEEGRLVSNPDISPNQIQPSSLDLRVAEAQTDSLDDEDW